MWELVIYEFLIYLFLLIWNNYSYFKFIWIQAVDAY
mgnify:CR=1 FL=1